MSDHAAASVLALDRGLAQALSDAQRAAAAAAATARIRALERGEWDAVASFGDCASWLGLLVLDGFILRRTSCAGETVAEIIGPGDMLRPWDHDGEYPVPGIATSWHVLEPASVALLDDGFVARVAPWPPLTAAILARFGRRARWSGLRLLISQIPGVEVRVLYLLWQLGERWGESVEEHLRIPIRLTHEHIGEVIGAQRPSVSHAVSRLRGEGVKQLAGEGWEIPRDVPETIDGLLRAPSAAPS